MRTSSEWLIDVCQMPWGQWRASAVRLGSLDPAVDGPYRDTADEALAALAASPGMRVAIPRLTTGG